MKYYFLPLSKITVVMLQHSVIWLASCALIFSITSCTSIPQREPLPENLSSVAKPLNITDLRMWGDEVVPHVKEWLTTDVDTDKYSAITGKPHNYLAISGGGANGAFGAGLLVGWSARGDRPEFTMVTGISTGALAAPFVFLGSDYDDELEQLYTTISTGDILKQRNFFSRFFSDSAMDSRPLAALLEHYIDEPMMRAIAAESKKGRSLHIGTTHLDAGRPVSWNIGKIARSGHPEALKLIRQILLASSSIPAIFPPVLIDVEAQGQRYDELHVDGGVSMQVFFYPAGVEWSLVLKKYKVQGTPHLYIIRNSRLDSRWKETTNKAIPIAARSLDTLIRNQGIGDLYRLYILTKRDGLDFNLAYIPNDFNVSQNEMFDPEYMKSLFDLGFNMGKNGYTWSKAPPEMKGINE